MFFYPCCRDVREEKEGVPLSVLAAPLSAVGEAGRILSSDVKCLGCPQSRIANARELGHDLECVKTNELS